MSNAISVPATSRFHGETTKPFSTSSGFTVLANKLKTIIGIHDKGAVINELLTSTEIVKYVDKRMNQFKKNPQKFSKLDVNAWLKS